jgi:outer membrane lipase/esterase
MRPISRQARWLVSALLVAATVCAGVAQAGELFVFGDSLSDTGNNAIAIHRDPNQLITGNSYVPTYPYASGSYSNGNVWVTQLALKLKLQKGTRPSETLGNDFAYGGARVAAEIGVPSTLTQLGFFLGRGHQIQADDVFVIATGGNDVRDALFAVVANPGNAATIIGNAAINFAGTVRAMVDTLQAQGAKHIVVWNTPDLGLVPAVRVAGAQASGTATLIASQFNAALAAYLAGEDGVVVFDVFGTLNAIVANKQSYGLVNVTDSSGNPDAGINPDTALFWDGIHPTAAGHRVLAEAVIAVWPDVHDGQQVTP